MSAEKPPITLASAIIQSTDVLAQEVGGEAVLLDMTSEQYFGLNPVGARIWALLPECPTLGDVHARLCSEYDADPAQIESDLLTLAQSLLAAGLAKAA